MITLIIGNRNQQNNHKNGHSGLLKYIPISLHRCLQGFLLVYFRTHWISSSVRDLQKNINFSFITFWYCSHAIPLKRGLVFTKIIITYNCKLDHLIAVFLFFFLRVTMAELAARLLHDQKVVGSKGVVKGCRREKTNISKHSLINLCSAIPWNFIIACFFLYIAYRHQVLEILLSFIKQWLVKKLYCFED